MGGRKPAAGHRAAGGGGVAELEVRKLINTGLPAHLMA